MGQLFRHQFWIVLAAGVVFFTNLGAVRLFDKDETLYASCAREMFQRGDWVVPMFNGEVFPDKPPLMYWLMIGGYSLFGVTEFAARFWSAVLGIATALATYHLGRLLFRAEVGFWAGLIVATSIIFTVSARAATVDSALTLATTLAMLAFVLGAGACRREPNLDAASTGGNAPPGALLSTSWPMFVLMYAAMAIAVLAKGPIGVLLPMTVLGLFLLLTTARAAGQLPDENAPGGILARCRRRTLWFLRLLSPGNLFRVVWQMRPVTALIVVATVAAPWFVLVGLRTDGVWLEKFFGEQNLARALKPFQGHSGPFFYYIIAIAIGFFPWSVFIGPSLWELGSRILRRHAWRRQYIFVACWLGVFVLFWSMVRTKLPHYVLPAYPALALLTATFVDGWITDPAHVRRCWGRNAAVTLVLVGIGMIIALPVVTAVYLPGEWPIALVGLPLVVGGAAVLFYLKRDCVSLAIRVFAVTSVVFLTAIFGLAALRVDRHQNAHVLLAEIRRHSPDTPQLTAYRFFKESYVFYAGGPVPRCRNAAELREFIGKAPHPYIITSDEAEEELGRDFPGEFRVLARRPRFLHSGEVVVLTPHPRRHVPLTAANPNSSNKR